MDKAPAPKPEPAPATNGSDQVGTLNYEAGRQAAHEGKIASISCPWAKGVKAHETWMAGYAAGQQEIQDGLVEPPEMNAV